MARKDVKVSETPKRKPPQSIEERENVMISLAMDRAEERLRNGTASSQEICHFLRLGTVKEEREREKMEEEIKLLKAKTKTLEEGQTHIEIVEKALKAMKLYKGEESEEDYE